MTSEPTVDATTPTNDDLRGENASVLLLVKRVQMIVRALIEDALRDEGLTAMQYTALTLLEQRGPMASAELARRCFVKPQTMHEILGGYERRGLVHKEIGSNNRRVLLVSLTEEGKKLLIRCQPAFRELEECMLQDMSPGQRIVFRESLQHSYALLSAEAHARNVVAYSVK